MGQTADELRRELDHKRQELSEDVDQLQHRMRSTFDLHHQVEERPLLMTGLAVAGGFLLGSMMGGGKKHRREYDWQDERWQQARNYPSGSGAPYSSIYSRPMASPEMEGEHDEGHGLLGGLTSNVTSGVSEGFRRGTGGRSFDDMLSSVSATMMALLVDRARDMLETNIPGFAQKYEQISRADGDGEMMGGRTTMGERRAGDGPAHQPSPMTRSSEATSTTTSSLPSAITQ